MINNSQFVLTGKLAYGSRNEVIKVIEFFGGRYSKTLTKQTDYLVIGTFTSNTTVTPGKSRKMVLAEKYNQHGSRIQFITEIELMNMLWESNTES